MTWADIHFPRHGTPVSARSIVGADGLFEAALGSVLVVGSATGWLGRGDFPQPAERTTILAFGSLLALVGVALFWLAATKPVTASLLWALATANVATAIAASAWMLSADGFSTMGSVLTVTTAATLVVLAAAQLGAATREARTAPRVP